MDPLLHLLATFQHSQRISHTMYTIKELEGIPFLHHVDNVELPLQPRHMLKRKIDTIRMVEEEDPLIFSAG